MLIREKIEKADLSNNEQAVAAYMLEKGTAIESMTIKAIAAATFTSPATMVRLARKLGYSGWNELKDEFTSEQNYLDTHFSGIDANYPFLKEDGRLTIASKLSILGQETLRDTESLLSDALLFEAARLLDRAENIYVFAVSNNLMYGEIFQFQMRRILKRVSVCAPHGEMQWAARLASSKDCALFISYSGETPTLVLCARYLHEHHVPIVSLTNIGSSSISALSDVVLHISTREKLYSKIGTFSTGFSVHYLLDVLYALVFARSYDKSLQAKVENGLNIETGRFSTSDILREENRKSD